MHTIRSDFGFFPTKIKSTNGGKLRPTKGGILAVVSKRTGFLFSNLQVYINDAYLAFPQINK